MYYKDSSEEAANFLRQLIPLMVEKNIPADPKNYAIWYEYVTGRNKALNNEMDALLRESSKFSEEIARDLFNRYLFSDDVEVVEDLKKSVNLILLEIIDSMTETEIEQKKFMGFLESKSIILDENISLEDIKRIIGELIAETDTAKDSNDALANKLSQARLKLNEIKSTFEHQKEDAQIDPLTGAKNKKGFDEALTSHTIQAIQSKKPLCLLMMEVDHFDAFHNKHGKVVGEAALKILVRVVKMNIKGADLVARFNDQQFALLLPNTPLKGAMVIGETIRKSVSAQKMKRKSNGSHIGNISISLGATVLQTDEKPEGLVQRSIKALSLAQSFGRNRIYQLDYVKDK